MPLIFQYGSNCNAARLNDKTRLDGAAEDRGRAQTIDEFDLRFDVWSQGNGCAASDLVPARGTGRHAWGVLYQLSDAGLEKLRKIEGKLYQEVPIRVRDMGGNEVEEPVTTFVVRHTNENNTERRAGLWTSADYVGHIVSGLRAHGVEEVARDYIEYVIDIAIETNAKAAEMAAEQSLLIEQLRRHQT
jgi:hypothetical protein